MKITIYLIAIASVLGSCSLKREEIANLTNENDSLKAALATSREMLFTLREVGSLIDSIDANRKALRVRVVEGTTLLSYQERLMEVNEYVKRSEEKLKDLRSALQAANTESEAYLMMVSSLQDELSISSDEIQRLMHGSANSFLIRMTLNKL
jgi:chromosome segregation ATPase